MNEGTILHVKTMALRPRAGNRWLRAPESEAVAAFQNSVCVKVSLVNVFTLSFHAQFFCRNY